MSHSMRARPTLFQMFGGLVRAAQTGGCGCGGRVEATAAAAAVRGVRFMSGAVEEATEEQSRAPQRHPRGQQPAGHGERFWVWHHIATNMVVYSLTPVLDINKAKRQFAFTGKKLVPAKIRKDYWRPLAMVELGAGKGEVGRSVYQKLRELKKRHELEWEDERLLNLPKKLRGIELNDMRGNFVADLAYVCAGHGKGNLVVVKEEEDSKVKKKKSKNSKVVQANQAGENKAIEQEQQQQEEEKANKAPKLHTVTVYWANEQDKYYAESWTDNVTHIVGIPDYLPGPKTKTMATLNLSAEADARSQAEAVATA